MGAVLAGGAGRRLGGDKALIPLAGRPLITFPLAALRAVVADVVIVAKAETRLPGPEELGPVRIVREPAAPRHPLVGILQALRTAAGRPVLVCAADLPFVTAAALAELARANPGGAPAVIAVGSDDGLQPLLGLYRPQAADLLRAATEVAAAPVRSAVAAIEPVTLRLGDEILFNVNTPQDLARAEARLAGER